MVKPGALASAVYTGTVVHNRRAAPAHRFTYPVCSWLLDLDELPDVDRFVTGFGYNRARPIGFWDADHFAGTGEPAASQVRRAVEAAGHGWPGGAVRVLTNCRMFGHVFNPVSFWYCYDLGGQLAVIVAEVNNTFGERHCYVSPLASARDRDRGEQPPEHWSGKKVFHVSPFFTLDGTYRFATPAPDERLRASIDSAVRGQVQFEAVMAMRRRPLGPRSAASVLARHPLNTARIVGRIHWEAFRLWRKGATYHPKPPYDPGAAREGVS